ncbi:glycosyltransferase family 4 protein [Aureimonas psammosilenae]|uniref:glycosyltransferase family 4 protein n=1 Tax=Aureimonas psammosilenae TaxID=2495496 RepID=UPI0012607D26|nr:glycosyltransferase family 4 protein [Aureimonas psammosilenae]
MRTALVTWDYPPSPSGLSTAAREIAESLKLAGADVTVFSMGRDDEAAIGGIRVVGCRIADEAGLGRLRLWGGVGHLAAPLAFRDAVLAEHMRRPFAVVEATNWYAPAVFLAGRPGLALVTRNSTPCAFSRDPPSSARDRFDGWMSDKLERRQARHSAGLISNTADHARRIAVEYGLEQGAQPHAVIGLSLPPEMIERGKAAAYPALEAGQAARLLFVGRAEHRKGFDALMEAAAILAREAEAGGPDFALRLAGVSDDALAGDLPEAARRRIEALGRVDESDLAAEYAGAHAVLAPSRYESFGLVYQEGMAYGRPMVASNEDASAREFVGQAGAGAMAETTSGPALADAIRAVLTNADYRRSLREKALLATGRFTRRTLGTETLALYEKALARV